MILYTYNELRELAEEIFSYDDTLYKDCLNAIAIVERRPTDTSIATLHNLFIYNTLDVDKMDSLMPTEEERRRDAIQKKRLKETFATTHDNNNTSV